MDPGKARSGSAQSGHHLRPPAVVLRSSPDRFPGREAKDKLGPAPLAPLGEHRGTSWRESASMTSKDRNNLCPDLRQKASADGATRPQPNTSRRFSGSVWHADWWADSLGQQ